MNTKGFNNNVYPERFSMLSENLPFKKCMKRPIVIEAAQMTEDFQVESIEGNYKQGKAGDYLMCGVDMELYICDKEIFDKSYDFVD